MPGDFTLRTITADEVGTPGSPYADCEVWDGIPVVCEPSKGWAEHVVAEIVARLKTHVRERRLGWVFPSSQGFLVARGPDRLLSPDAAFLSRGRLAELPRDEWIPMPPDLAVEVRSPSDGLGAALAKGHLWLASGTPVVWVVDPDARVVFDLRPSGPARMVRAGGQLDAEPVLPAFRLPVRALFEDLPGGASLSGPVDPEPPAP